jgi:peptidoglycan/xylan/chitin deacetylase (PgdA/CDA1 family)
MTRERRPGMDHAHYAWSPIAARPKLAWPGGARVALCAIVVLEHLEWAPPRESVQSPNLYLHYGVHRPIPEFWSVSHREYGHRVGIFRVLDVLEKHGIPATIAIDAMTARHYPWLVRHCAGRARELIAHGISASRMITSRMSEPEERAHIAESIDAVRAGTGTAPRGWFGPEYGESQRTLALLAEAGLDYVCDWVNDEQPYRMNAAQPFYALPAMLELDDAFALRDRRFRVDEYAVHLAEAFDTVHRDGAASGRTLVITLHPWLMGQPFRIGFLDDALAHMMKRDGVWPASAGEIIDAYRVSRGSPEVHG